jgi:hypothetical protein
MSQPPTVLAIDPGTVESGYMLYSGGGVVESGVRPNHKILELIVDPTVHPEPDVLAIEMVSSYGMPVGREVFETVVWIGRFQQTWPWDPDTVLRVPRLKVKMHLCHSARAKDSHIWQALIDRFGPVGTKGNPGPLYGVKSHARAALALAVTVADGAA